MKVVAHLGHSAAKTTLDVDGHVFLDEEDRTKAAVDAALAALDVVVEHELTSAPAPSAPICPYAR